MPVVVGVARTSILVWIAFRGLTVVRALRAARSFRRARRAANDNVAWWRRGTDPSPMLVGYPALGEPPDSRSFPGREQVLPVLGNQEELDRRAAEVLAATWSGIESAGALQRPVRVLSDRLAVVRPEAFVQALAWPAKEVRFVRQDRRGIAEEPIARLPIVVDDARAPSRAAHALGALVLLGATASSIAARRSGRGRIVAPALLAALAPQVAVELVFRDLCSVGSRERAVVTPLEVWRLRITSSLQRW